MNGDPNKQTKHSTCMITQTTICTELRSGPLFFPGSIDDNALACRKEEILLINTTPFYVEIPKTESYCELLLHNQVESG